MKKDQFISIQDIADFCHVAVDVLQEWAEDGLITISVREKSQGIPADEVGEIRRIARLYKELGVNREGIEIITAMRSRILELSREAARLRHELERLQNDHKLRYLEIPRSMGLIIDYYEEDE
jgi:DNA-binding transcriptional MerR regulator